MPRIAFFSNVFPCSFYMPTSSIYYLGVEVLRFCCGEEVTLGFHVCLSFLRYFANRRAYSL